VSGKHGKQQGKWWEKGGQRVGKGWEKGGKRVGSKLVAQALLGMMPAQVGKFDGGTISFQACL